MFPVSATVFLVFGTAVQVVCLGWLLFSWSNLDLKGRGELALFDQALLEKVVNCGHLVMFVAIQTLCCIVFFEAISFEVTK